jgi:hypothetical protein
MWKKMVKADGPSTTIYYSAEICDLYVGYVGLQADIENV